jgi:hypothetical protein
MSNVLSPTGPWSSQDKTWYNKTAVAATDTSSLKGADRFTQLLLVIKTANVTGTGPTLDVKLQTLLPDGTTWCDIAAFTQITNATTRVMGFISSGNAEFQQTDGTLAANTIKTVPLGRVLRLKLVIGGTNPKFDITAEVELLS